MDKYEYKLKLEQLKNLVEEKNYKTAAEIADSINWRKVKSSATLCMVGEIYDRCKRYEESHEILLMAYDRAAVGRNILYRLTLVSLKMGNLDEAKDYFEEFLEVAPYDNQKYILRYQIEKMSGASLDHLIGILEEFKEREYREEWAFELAYLYHRAGNSERCVEVCDELILWIGDGKYVEKALELKMLYQPLTLTQEQKYREFKQLKEGVVEVRPTDELESGELVRETMQIPNITANTGRFNTQNLQAEIAKSMQQILDANTKETVNDTMDNLKKIVEDIPYLQVTQEIPDRVREDERYGHIETDEEIDDTLKNQFAEMLAEEWDGQIRLSIQGGGVREPQVNGQIGIEEVLAEWEKTRLAAETAMAEAQQKRLESAKARAMQEAWDLLERLHDIIPKLEAGVSPKELLEEQYLQNTPSNNRVIPEEVQMPQELQAPEDIPIPEGVQIPREIQMPEDIQLPEGIQAPEDTQLPEGIQIPEEVQMPEDIIKQSEPTPSDLVASWEEAARILGEPIPEEYLQKLREESAAKEAAEKEAAAQAEQENLISQEQGNLSSQEQGNIASQEQGNITSQEQGNITSQGEENITSQMGQESITSQEKESISAEEPKDVSVEDTQKESPKKKDAGEYLQSVFQAANESRKEKDSVPKIEIEEPEEHISKLSPEQKKIFSYFVPISGMEQQLCQVLEGALNRKGSDHTSSSGNILIIGGRGSGKTVLATDLIKVIQRSGKHSGSKVGKITGASLNEKDLSQLLKKVMGGYLIVEKAGDISQETATRLSLLMEQNTDGLLFILEDTGSGIEKLLSKDANFAKKFTERIKIPVFTSDELVEFAKAYADEQECEIDDMGILALYNRISNIQKIDEATTLAEVKEIVDEAIARAERGRLKKFFGAKKFNPQGYLYLREKDFED